MILILACMFVFPSVTSVSDISARPITSQLSLSFSLCVYVCIYLYMIAIGYIHFINSLWLNFFFLQLILRVFCLWIEILKPLTSITTIGLPGLCSVNLFNDFYFYCFWVRSFFSVSLYLTSLPFSPTHDL